VYFNSVLRAEFHYKVRELKAVRLIVWLSLVKCCCWVFLWFHCLFRWTSHDPIYLLFTLHLYFYRFTSHNKDKIVLLVVNQEEAVHVIAPDFTLSDWRGHTSAPRTFWICHIRYCDGTDLSPASQLEVTRIVTRPTQGTGLLFAFLHLQTVTETKIGVLPSAFKSNISGAQHFWNNA
jgi:hypothetical protein